MDVAKTAKRIHIYIQPGAVLMSRFKKNQIEIKTGNIINSATFIFHKVVVIQINVMHLFQSRSAHAITLLYYYRSRSQSIRTLVGTFISSC